MIELKWICEINKWSELTECLELNEWSQLKWIREMKWISAVKWIHFFCDSIKANSSYLKLLWISEVKWISDIKWITVIMRFELFWKWSDWILICDMLEAKTKVWWLKRSEKVKSSQCCLVLQTVHTGPSLLWSTV